MKMTNKKMKKMLAIAGISSSLLFLTACDDTYKINGKKVKKTYVDGVEGYNDENGVFIPYNFKLNATTNSGDSFYHGSGSGLGSGWSEGASS